jgi:hypothetical protein
MIWRPSARRRGVFRNVPSVVVRPDALISVLRSRRLPRRN